MRDLKLERLERGDQMPVEEFNERSNEIKGDIDAPHGGYQTTAGIELQELSGRFG